MAKLTQLINLIIFAVFSNSDNLAECDEEMLYGRCFGWEIQLLDVSVNNHPNYFLSNDIPG